MPEQTSHPHPPEGSPSGALSRETTGLLCSLGAFLIWGLSPLFWKLIAEVPSRELVAHRVLWCSVLMGLLLVVQKRWGGLAGRLLRGRTPLILAVTTVLIATNWYLFIYAVNSGRVLQASLGYFINPLISVMLGMLVLGEKMRRAQWVSIFLAAGGVLILTLRLGTLPWLSLALAVTFGFYSLLRKQVDAEPAEGLFVETLILSPFLIADLLMRHQDGTGSFLTISPKIDILLILTGAITAVPLVLFTYGARRLPLSTIGIMQYLAPTGQFLLAVFVFHEPFEQTRLLAFLCIWTALAIFTWDARRAWKERQAASKAANTSEAL